VKAAKSHLKDGAISGIVLIPVGNVGSVTEIK